MPSSRRSGAGPAHRRAFSLVEILVVLAVIGMLAALLLSAVQAAREAARRSQCTNNLQRIGLGVHSFEAAKGVFPTGSGFSFHCSILPYVEQRPLHNSVNFEVGPMEGVAGSRNSTALFVSLSVFLCPSDSSPSNRQGWTNYAGNRGPFVGAHVYDGAFPSPLRPPLGSQSFPDGSAATVGVSEWVLGLASPTDRDPRRSIYATDLDATGRLDSPCHSVDTFSSVLGTNDKGSKWLFGDYIHTQYNHALRPGDHSCTNQGSVQDGVFSAGSQHPHGVNCLFMDGHAAFVGETTDLAVWRAIGTRNGGEVMGGSAY